MSTYLGSPEPPLAVVIAIDIVIGAAAIGEVVVEEAVDDGSIADGYLGSNADTQLVANLCHSPCLLLCSHDRRYTVDLNGGLRAETTPYVECHTRDWDTGDADILGSLGLLCTRKDRGWRSIAVTVSADVDDSLVEMQDTTVLNAQEERHIWLVTAFSEGIGRAGLPHGDYGAGNGAGQGRTQAVVALDGP
jgi:hypothetical protein